SLICSSKYRLLHHCCYRFPNKNPPTPGQVLDLHWPLHLCRLCPRLPRTLCLRLQVALHHSVRPTCQITCCRYGTSTLCHTTVPIPRTESNDSRGKCLRQLADG